MVDKKSLGAYLKDLRTDRVEEVELSLRTVADRCRNEFDVKISHEQIRQIEEGLIRDPGAEKIGALARIYNVDPMDLISRIEKKS
jgi:transcriptional regulator with XRE-family HTH domain